MEAVSLTKNIKTKALELGFSIVGIVPASELKGEGERLRDWLHRGYHASMEWMNRDIEKRVDPRNVLPDVKSVVCVAMNYYSATNHSEDSTAGKISRYAWGDDYHLVLPERLEQLLAFIQSLWNIADSGKATENSIPATDSIAPSYPQLRDRILRHGLDSWQVAQNIPGSILTRIPEPTTNRQLLKEYLPVQ